MERRRRIDIFFILYLTALAAFVVVLRERDRRDELLELRARALLASFLPPLPLQAARDTIVFYVSADTSGRVRGGMPAEFHITASDIGPEDRITMTLDALSYDGVLVSPTAVRIGRRTAMGAIEERRVRFPITCEFTRTGRYDLLFDARSERVHPEGEGRLRYRDRVFDETPLTQKLREDVERTELRVTIQVVDTTARGRMEVAPLQLRLERSVIVTAQGFEARNEIAVNNVALQPSLRVLSGGGTLRPLPPTRLEARWEWSETPGIADDSVVLEARLWRGAGSRDIARATFFVRAQQPMLTGPLPWKVYAGEDLRFDLRVSGLDDAERYRWDLFEVTPGGEAVRKAGGGGPVVSWHIPNNYTNKLLLVRSSYDDRPYRYIDPGTHAGGVSEFRFSVSQPPTRIRIDIPEVLRAGQDLEFRVSKYSDPVYAGDQPVSRLRDIQVFAVTDDSVRVPFQLFMLRPGMFRLSPDAAAWQRAGVGAMRLRIVAADAVVERVVRLK